VSACCFVSSTRDFSEKFANVVLSKFRYIGSVTRGGSRRESFPIPERNPRGNSRVTRFSTKRALSDLFKFRFEIILPFNPRLIIRPRCFAVVPFAVNNYGNSLLLCERNINICGFPCVCVCVYELCVLCHCRDNRESVSLPDVRIIVCDMRQTSSVTEAGGRGWLIISNFIC